MHTSVTANGIGNTSGVYTSDVSSILSRRFGEMREGVRPLWRGVVFGYHSETAKPNGLHEVRVLAGDDYVLLAAVHDPVTVTNAYLGFKKAIGDFFVAFNSAHNQEVARVFSRRLREALGEGFDLLADFVPEAAPHHGTASPVLHNLIEIEKQLFPVITDFFQFIVDYFRKPVLFFADDLHWIDGPGLALLRHLLTVLPDNSFCWIGNYRTGEEGLDPLFRMVEEQNRDHTRIEHYRLGLFSREDLRALVIKMFGTAPPEEFVALCQELCQTGHHELRYTLSQLTSAGLVAESDGVLQFDREAIEKFLLVRAGNDFSSKWVRLSRRCQEIMCVAACCPTVDPVVLAQWLGAERELLEGLLSEALSHELIQRTSDGFSFTVFVAEEILRMISDDRKQHIHYLIGRVMYERGGDMADDGRLILVAEQFNNGISLVRLNHDQKLCAGLNLRAGDFYRQRGDSNRARYFYNTGAELLKEIGLTESEDLLFEIHYRLGKLNYELQEYNLAELHIDHLMERVKDAAKRALLFELKIVINNRLGRYRKAVLTLKEGLMEYGLEMPLDDNRVNDDVERIKRQLDTTEGVSWSEDSETDDISRRAILKLLFVGGMSLHHASSALMSWGAMQIIFRSGSGLKFAEKAIGYVVYGRVRIIQNEIEDGFQFGEKGIEINRTLNDVGLRCRVYGVFSFFILPWKKPFRESYALLEEALSAGTHAGDLIGAYVIRTHQFNLYILEGKSLLKVLSVDFNDANPGNELTYYITHYQRNLVKFLLGQSAVFSIPHLQPSWLAATNTIQEEKFYRNLVWSRYYFLFGYYDLAVSAARQANENRKLQEGSPLIPANFMIWAISICQNWQNYSSDEREEHMVLLGGIRSDFEVWSRHSPANYAACSWLLQAEWQRILGNTQEAIAAYEAALATSGDNLWYRALISECMAKCFLHDHSERSRALTHLENAMRFYTEWGAIAKVKQLAQQFRTILTTEHAVLKDINIELVQQELSGDLQIHSIVKKLLSLSMRISGSTAAVLTAFEGSSDLKHLGHLSLLTRADGWHDEPDVLYQISLAYRSQNVVTGHSPQDGITRSFVSLPVTVRDHLSFVLYLENAIAPADYSGEVIKWIQITVNQGAMIIENAHIHEITLRLNDEILQKMDEKEKLMEEIQRERDGHLKALEQIQNEERKRIAGHLHDSVGSMLSSVKLRLNSMQEDIEKNVPGKSEKYMHTISLVDEAVQELRRIVYNMLPVSLTKFGLREALQSFVSQINDAKSTTFELQILGLEDRLRDELEMAIYRVCQELVQNVLKHAHASFARLQLIRRDGVINIIIEDNGIGMDRETVIFGMGFNTIRTKVNLYKGTFTIESAEGKGAMILIDIPE
jgi:signal transduction histidine kinase/predicted ATPase